MRSDLFYAAKQSVLLVVIIIFGSINVIGPVRLLEITLPLLIFLNLWKTDFKVSASPIVAIGVITALLVVFRGMIFLHIESLAYALRLVSSLLSGFVLYTFCIRFTNGASYSKSYAFVLISCFYLGLYNYFWEYTYLLSSAVAVSLSAQSLFTVGIVIAVLDYIGQRTYILNILYLSLVYFYFFAWRKKLVAVAVMLLLVLPFVASHSSRAIDTFRSIDPVLILNSINLAVESANYYSYDDFVYGQRRTFFEDGDLSFDLRLRKWSHALSASTAGTFFIGLGPGYFGKAADGGWVRIFFEYGIIITFLIFWVLRRLYVNSNSLQRTLLGVFVVSNCFLDIIYSPMMVGYLGALMAFSRTIR